VARRHAAAAAAAAEVPTAVDRIYCASVHHNPTASEKS